MKRKVKERRLHARRIWDPKKDLTQKHLAALGAANLAWNEAEATFDVLFCVVTLMPHVLWREIATRINGIEGKKAIVEAAMERRFGVRDGFLHVSITDTFAAMMDYRKYRDLIVHSRIVDRLSHIGESALKRGDVQEVLMSEPALNALYDHTQALTRELYALVTWFQAMVEFMTLGHDEKGIPHLIMEQIMARQLAVREGIPPVLGFGGAEIPSKQRIELEAQHAFSRYDQAHKARRSLPPLPPFPEESRTPPATTGTPA